jgi:hypothetical protein
VRRVPYTNILYWADQCSQAVLRTRCFFDPLDPGFGMEKIRTQDPGYGMNTPNLIFENLVSAFALKIILKFSRIWIWDLVNSEPGIRDGKTGSVTLRTRQEKNLLSQSRQAQRTNQGRALFICTPSVPICLSFNSQQGPPLSCLSCWHFIGLYSIV